MAKNIKEQTRQVKSIPEERTIIPLKFQHPAAMAVIYVCLLIFFHAIVFEGKTYQSVDSIASHSWETLTNDARTEGIFPLWNPYIFCGMPGFASLTFSIERPYDFTTYAFNTARNIFGYLFVDKTNGVWLLFYLIYGIGIYLFAYKLFKNKPVSLIVSLMTVFSTDAALYIMLGHGTKIAVLAWFPYLFLFVDKLREKFNIIYLLLLSIVVRLMIEPGHVQFIFYIYLALGFYFLFFLIRALIKKENWKGLLISGISLVCATLFAFFMGADQHLSTLEYNAYSIRGTNPITHTSTTAQAKTVEGGLDYDYATNWSLSPGEVMTFFIPSWYGFGWHSYEGPLTQNRKIQLNTYWGPQPQPVDNPHYMGLIAVVLAVIGFLKYRKEPFVQFMGLTIVVSLFVAFGREFPLIYDVLYRYLPMFNKFRIPLMILTLVQFFIPFLAGYGVLSFVSTSKKSNSTVEKKWKYIFGFLALCFVGTLIGKDIIKDIYSSFFPMQEVGKILAQYYGTDVRVLSMLYDFVFSSVITDMLIGCVLLFIVFGALYYYQRGKIKSAPLFSLLIIMVLFDLWRVASQPSEPKNKQESIQEMPTPDYVKVLLQDTTQFRVLNIENGQPAYGNNSLAYWRIQNAFGYQGAKMRIYQDMADVAGIGNPLVWQLMNVKYLICNRDESGPGLTQVYDSPNIKVYAIQTWLPRVFFVNKCEVADGLSILNKIASLSFNPRDTGYLLEKSNIDIDPPLAGAEASIVHYGIHDIEVRATATGNNLLFLSESYYPKGWKAYLDGKETDILRLNYLFRGVIIPQGIHTLSMKYESNTYFLGKNISLSTNTIIFIGLIIQGFFLYKKKRTEGSPQA